MTNDEEKKARQAARAKKKSALNKQMKAAGSPFSNTTMAERLDKQRMLGEQLRKIEEAELLD